MPPCSHGVSRIPHLTNPAPPIPNRRSIRRGASTTPNCLPREQTPGGHKSSTPAIGREANQGRFTDTAIEGRPYPEFLARFSGKKGIRRKSGDVD